MPRYPAAVAYYRQVSYARDERLALCARLDEAGPNAPTLCAGWQTVDLAAHLVLRERRPDAAVGILGGPLARYTRMVQRDLAERTPFPDLVEAIRTGPPSLSVYALPGADARLNFMEFFVHHEDVRRAEPDWQPRDLSTDLTDLIWRQLTRARLMLRKVPVGIEFARSDSPAQATNGAGHDHPAGRERLRITVRPRTPVVTVVGAPAELLMWTFGRTGAARIRLEGAEDDVAALGQARWGI
jgi:uncharacterized protein (TIGR03085 family)